jgi:hypothetical protein
MIAKTNLSGTMVLNRLYQAGVRKQSGIDAAGSGLERK